MAGPEERALAPWEEVQDWIGKAWSRLEESIPKHVDRARFRRMLLDQVRSNPSIQDCEPRSIFRACVKAANLGLELGVANSAHLVPYKKGGTKYCELIIGYGGMLQLAHRYGELSGVNVVLIREGDEVVQQVDGVIRGVVNPLAVGREDLPPTGVIVTVTMRGGAQQFTALSWGEYLKLRPPHWERTPHATNPEEMCKKTGLRRALKYVPMSAEAQSAMEESFAVEDSVPAEVEIAARRPAPKKRGNAGVREALGMDSRESVSFEMPEREPEFVPAQSPVAPVQRADGGVSVPHVPSAVPPPAAPSHKWDLDLASANALIRAMRVPSMGLWREINDVRKKLISARMVALGLDPKLTAGHYEMWERMNKALLPFDANKVASWSVVTLEQFLRVPQRGGIDHFTLATEGSYRPTSIAKPKEPEAADELWDGDPPVSYEDAPEVAPF